MADKYVHLHIDGQDHVIDMPLVKGTLGPDVINIHPLSKAGVFTSDPGFVSTASCQSAITFIDGPDGVLLHRWVPDRTIGRAFQFHRAGLLAVSR